MKIRSALSEAAFMLGLTEAERAFSTGSHPSGETGEQMSALIKCACLVVDEIAADYSPLKVREEVFAEGGKLNYDKLSRPIVDLFSATDGCGRRVRAKRLADGLVLPREGKYTIEYSYSPGEVDADGELPFTERISSRIFAYGIACEYCLATGSISDAATFDKRYRDALHRAQIEKSGRRIPARRWE